VYEARDHQKAVDTEYRLCGGCLLIFKNKDLLLLFNQKAHFLLEKIEINDKRSLKI
jgi:hypothetical protein